MCTEDSPCEVCKVWLPEAWQAEEKANEQKRKRKAAAAAKAAKKSHERETMDDSVEIHALEDALQLPPTKLKSNGSSKTKRAKQPQVLGQRLRRWSNLPAGLPGPMSPRSLCLPACLWWDGPGPTVFPGPRGRNATGHVVGSPIDDHTGPTDAMTLQGPIILLDTTVDIERGSGPGPRHRVGPAPGGRLILRVVRGRAVSLRGRRMSGLQGLPLIPITIITSLRVIVGPCLHHHQVRRQIASLRLVIIKMEDVKVLRGLDHPTSPDGRYSCPRPLPSHQRKEHHGDPFAAPARTR